MTRASIAFALIALGLAGCASFSDDAGQARVATLSRERIGFAPADFRGTDEQTVSRRRDALLAAPLSADGAVELALLNNRGLRADLADLGLAESDLVSAGRLPNPGFTFSRIGARGAVEIDRSVTIDVVALLTMPARSGIERSRFERAQVRAALAVLTVANDTRRAWVDAVATAQLARYQDDVDAAAAAASELAQRLQDAGNLDRLSRLREQAFEAEARAGSMRARQRVVAARERLTRLLGLDDPTSLRLPDRLPELPALPVERPALEQAAIERRLDVLAARRELDASADARDLSRATRFVNVLDVGWRNKSETGSPRLDGYEVSLELPLFDGGAVKRSRAETAWRQAFDHAADVATVARSQVREAHAGYVSAWQLARHQRDVVLPMRERAAEENLLRYNGMLIDVFSLLAETRAQIGGVTASIEALRDFWLADADLQASLAGRT